MKKKKFNKKIILGFTSIIACLGIIVVTSFFPLIFDPSNFLTKEFLTNEIIIIAIVIFSMVSSIFIGQASNSSNPDSEIAKSIVRFNESVKQITNFNAFSQWVRKVQQPKDIQLIKERKMREMGIEDFSIINLDNTQIKNLINNAQRYDGVYYKSITELQAKGLIELKTKFDVKLVEPSYYLTFKSYDADKTITEKAGNEGKKKSMMVITSVGSKAIMTLVVAVVFASLVFDKNVDIQNAQLWTNFVSRILAMLSSAFMGYIVGSQINDIDAEYIKMRILVHQQFLEDKEFKPLTQQEEAKKEFAERVKKENEIIMIGGGEDGKER